MNNTKEEYPKSFNDEHLNFNENNVNKVNTNNKKRKKRRKRKLKKILIFIAFVLVILGTFFIIKMNENGWTYGGLLATILGHNSKTAEELGTVYILVTGESQNLTDSIMVCAYNPKTEQASMMSIPRDTYTGSNQNKATASDKINVLYEQDPQKLLQEVNEITGLNIQYYMNIDTEALKEIVDTIGGVYFDVPIDMDYDDNSQNLHIHLQAGYQLLDGDKAEQVLRFRHNNDGTSYPANYGDNDFGRMKTQREFIKALASELKSLKTIVNAKEYLKIAKNNITTNFDLDTAINYLPYILDFNTDNLTTATLPGESKLCNGVWLYIADEDETEELVANMFEALN